MLGIEQKKGDDNSLCGRMIAYAKILPVHETSVSISPFDDMIKNGLLVLEGDFRKFIEAPNAKKMLNEAVDDRINSMIETMEENGIDLPENIDVDALKDRLHELNNMEVIPIPARIGKFEREDEILEQDADIYYVGEFLGANQAHYCLTTLPIFYQAKYREQVKVKEMESLTDLIAELENSEFFDFENLPTDGETLFPVGATLNTYIGDLEQLLNAHVIPFFLKIDNAQELEVQSQVFKKFMENYPDQSDVDAFIGILHLLRNQQESLILRKILTIIGKKISSIINNNPEDIKKYTELQAILLKELREQLPLE